MRGRMKGCETRGTELSFGEYGLQAIDRGCRYQIGTDMLFEMIPAYLEFFGFGTATPDELRAVARVSY
jgi:hypothetical protein